MFIVYQNASRLPDIWDEIVAKNRSGPNVFLTKEVLEKLEQVNPCGQLYHLDPEHRVAFVSYRLQLNIVTFTKYFSLKIPTHIIGLPISVAKAGYAMAVAKGGSNGNSNESSNENSNENLNENSNKNCHYVSSHISTDEMVKYIKSLKGLHLILNADDSLNLAQGSTLPTCKMDIHWNSFEQYLVSMRSPYRYRANKAIRRFADITVEELVDNNLFTDELYRLYEDVYQRSSEKLEKQSIEFFKKFPATIITFSIGNEVIAFVQLVDNHDELIFLFGGFSYSVNGQYDLYMNMLLYIIRYGIKSGAKRIDFGQTAEETKLKLGAIQHPKFLYIQHSNPIINAYLSKVVGAFSYNAYKIEHKVFKE